jgi:hypothetical protein
LWRGPKDAENKISVQFNEKYHSCVWICNVFALNIKIKNKIKFISYLPTLFFFFSKNTFFFLVWSNSICSGIRRYKLQTQPYLFPDRAGCSWDSSVEPRAGGLCWYTDSYHYIVVGVW